METGLLNNILALLPGKQVRSGLMQYPQSSGRFENSRGYLLGFDTYGSQSGYPLFYFHDAGSSRLQAAFFHRAARQQGYRLIAIDRPGIGCSDYYPLEHVSDFCRDVLELAAELQLKAFGVMSFGAGGVYATTLAYMAPEQVKVHLNLTGIPGNVFNELPGNTLSGYVVNGLTPALVKIAVLLRHIVVPDNPEHELERMREYLSVTDRKVLAIPWIRKMLTLDQHEVFRQGARGAAQDIGMCFRKLEFRLHEVDAPTQVWQGSADRLSSRSDCEYLVSRLQQARFFRVSNRGHFFFVNYMDQVFSRLRDCAETSAKLAA